MGFPHPAKVSRHSRAFLVVAIGILLFIEHAFAVTVNLNGLEITVDDQTGELQRLNYPPVGTILEAQAKLMAIHDGAGEKGEEQTNPATGVASSVDASDATLATAEARRSDVTLNPREGGLTIGWSEAADAPSGAKDAEKAVQYQIDLSAAPDGRSVILRGEVLNQTNQTLQQVAFPRLMGLRAFDEPQRMELRMALGAINPFAGDPFSIYYHPNGQYEMNALRWMDYGSLMGGISLFERHWLTEPRPSFFATRSAGQPDRFDLQWIHRVSVPAGQKWTSHEIWLTPHRGGWAKGIEPFRSYVRQVNPPRQVPDRVRDDVAFATFWMIEGNESDPLKAYFRYTDLENMALDCLQYGVREVVLWGSVGYGTLPIPYAPMVGTQSQFANGVKAARQHGVNMVPFINVTSARILGKAELDRMLQDREQGFLNGKSNAKAVWEWQPGFWTYHQEFIPAMIQGLIPAETLTLLSLPRGPSYSPEWQDAFRRTLVDWAQKGVASFCYDVFEDDGTMQLTEMVQDIREELLQIDPESSFAGEPVNGSLERAAQVLDYSWNWLDYIEAGPFHNVIRYPRFNCNVKDSVRVAKMGFADGLYLNIHPKRPNQANGSKLISEEPALANALKVLSARREQFLPFFNRGIFIGESVLSAPVCDFVRQHKPSWIGGAVVALGPFEYPEKFVRGHILDNRLLIIAMNNAAEPQAIELTTEPGMWIPAQNEYRLTAYDENGQVLQESIVNANENGTVTLVSPELDPLELAFFVLEAPGRETTGIVWDFDGAVGLTNMLEPGMVDGELALPIGPHDGMVAAGLDGEMDLADNWLTQTYETLSPGLLPQVAHATAYQFGGEGPQATDFLLRNLAESYPYLVFYGDVGWSRNTSLGGVVTAVDPLRSAPLDPATQTGIPSNQLRRHVIDLRVAAPTDWTGDAAQIIIDLFADWGDPARPDFMASEWLDDFDPAPQASYFRCDWLALTNDPDFRLIHVNYPPKSSATPRAIVWDFDGPTSDLELNTVDGDVVIPEGWRRFPINGDPLAGELRIEDGRLVHTFTGLPEGSLPTEIHMTGTAVGNFFFFTPPGTALNLEDVAHNFPYLIFKGRIGWGANKPVGATIYANIDTESWFENRIEIAAIRTNKEERQVLDLRQATQVTGQYDGTLIGLLIDWYALWYEGASPAFMASQWEQEFDSDPEATFLSLDWIALSRNERFRETNNSAPAELWNLLK